MLYRRIYIARKHCREDAEVWQELGGSDPEEDFAGELGIHSQGVMGDQDTALELREFAWPTLRYNASLGWIAWDGKVWRTDAPERARLTVMAFNDTKLAMARTDTGDDAKKLMKHAMALRGTGRINAMLLNAQALLTDNDPWDPDPWLLNTPAGVIDLKDGSIRPHDSELRMTSITSVAPDGAEPRRWLKFVREAVAGDDGLEDYLQQVLGMALVGKVYEEGLLIVTGPGGNGKSTLFGACQRVLGGYAGTIRPELLLVRPG